MEILKLLNDYQDISNKIFECFGIPNGYGEINLAIDVKWDCNDSEVKWVNDGFYSNAILSGPYIFENFTMYYVDNYSDEKFYQIFNNDLKIENLEDKF